MSRPKTRGFILTDLFVEFRMVAGLDQADIARRAGTTQSTISRLESRGAQMRPDRARRLAGAINMTLEQALEAGLIAWPNGSKGEA